MTDLTEYTSTTRIRNSLGLTDNEVPDSMITDQSLDTALLVDLDSWYPLHETLWESYRHRSPSDPTAEEKQKGRMLQLYATQFCAAYLSSMWLAMPQTIGDGKSTMSRFARLDLAALAVNMNKRAATTKARLTELETPTIGVATPTLAAIASPSFDPVTGQVS